MLVSRIAPMLFRDLGHRPRPRAAPFETHQAVLGQIAQCCSQRITVPVERGIAVYVVVCAAASASNGFADDTRIVQHCPAVVGRRLCLA